MWHAEDGAGEVVRMNPHWDLMYNVQEIIENAISGMSSTISNADSSRIDSEGVSLSQPIKRFCKVERLGLGFCGQRNISHPERFLARAKHRAD